MTSLSTEPDTTTASRTPNVTAFYTAQSIGLGFRQWAFVIFTVALPVMMYLLFSQLFGGFTEGETTVGALIMVNMAAYGALGAALTAGAQLQIERRSGWFRQLMLTGLTPAGFLTGKIATALALVLPAIIVVFLIGFTVGGVRAPANAWLMSGALIWVSVLTMVLLGLVLALWLKSETVGAVSTILLLGLAALGGLWIPVDMMPGGMATLAKAMPSYWIGEFGRWPLVGGSFPMGGLAIMGGWVVALAALGALGYRRAIVESKR